MKTIPESYEKGSKIKKSIRVSSIDMPHTTLHKVLVPGTNRPKVLSDIILLNSKKY